MKKQKRLFLSIPQPCEENWDAMDGVNGHKFCGRCQKTLVDYTLLSDRELFAFVSTQKEVPCGRFYKHQLNRTLVVEEHKKTLPGFFLKPFAALLVLASLRSAAADPQKKMQVATNQIMPQHNDSLPQGQAVISGTILNDDKQPLEDAIVLFNQVEMAKTDSNGFYQFTIDGANIQKTNLIQFKYPGMIVAVRNYYPSMGTTKYDAHLSSAIVSSEFVTMGAPQIPSLSKKYDLKFAGDIVAINIQIKNQLALLAAELRNKPNISVKLNGYFLSSKKKLIAEKRLNNVKKHLTEIEGISADRLKTNATNISSNYDVIEIIAEESE